MSPYTVIEIVIFVLGCVQSYAWHRARKAGQADWFYVGLLGMVLEVEARKARDQQKIRDRARKDP